MTNLPTNKAHATVIFVRGLPGSGKSYVADKLKETLTADKVIVLDPDATDYKSQEYLAHTKTLAAEGVDQKLHAYRFLRAKAYAGIVAGKIIIWNQPFTNLEIFRKMIARLQTHAAAHDTDLSILVVEVEIDPSTAKHRVIKRKQGGGHGPSTNTFERFTKDYTSFANQGYTTITVRGTDDVTTSVSTIRAALKELREI